MFKVHCVTIGILANKKRISNYRLPYPVQPQKYNSLSQYFVRHCYFSPIENLVVTFFLVTFFLLRKTNIFVHQFFSCYFHSLDLVCSGETLTCQTTLRYLNNICQTDLNKVPGQNNCKYFIFVISELQCIQSYQLSIKYIQILMNHCFATPGCTTA